MEIVYDPARVSYEKLLEVFWMSIDPTDGGGQFIDRDSQYRSAILCLDETQKRLAEASKAQLARSGKFGRRSSPGSSRPVPSILQKATIRTTTG